MGLSAQDQINAVNAAQGNRWQQGWGSTLGLAGSLVGLNTPKPKIPGVPGNDTGRGGQGTIAGVQNPVTQYGYNTAQQVGGGLGNYGAGATAAAAGLASGGYGGGGQAQYQLPFKVGRP